MSFHWIILSLVILLIASITFSLNKKIPQTDISASYFDLHLEINNEGRLRTKHYVKGDDFNFPIMNFPFISSNIPVAPAYGVYISDDLTLQSLWFLS